MRYILSLIVTVFGFHQVSLAQLHNPVDWQFSSKHIEGNQYELIFNADIEPGWSIYGLTIPVEGPVPTSIEFNSSKGFEKVGKIKESGKKKTAYDEVWEAEVSKFFTKATFKQKVKVANPGKTTIKGGVNFMVCNDERCLPPEFVEFSIKPKKPKTATPPVVANKPKPKPTPIPVVPEPVAINPTKGTIKEDRSDNSLPVLWEVEGIRVNKDEYDVIFKANIKDGWKLYSQYTGGNSGPYPTTFDFREDDRIEVKRKAKETGSKSKSFDELFNMNLSTFQEDATFTQRIKIEKGSRKIDGNIFYVASKGAQSIPPHRVGFSIQLPSKITPTPEEIAKQKRERERLLAQQEIREADEKGEQVTQEEETTDTETASTETNAVAASTGDNNTKTGQYQGDKFDYTLIGDDCSGETSNSDNSLLWIFILGFGGGLVALLTPCVFPMIPITVSYFTNSSKNRATGIRNALLYGSSIIGIYVALGTLITFMFGADALNKMASGAVFNLIFFAIFILFAISFLGYFEITLPSSWANKTDRMADKGGLLGIFFMAFTLSLVSFSCTGPIIGTLLVETAAGGNLLYPAIGMLGFSTALALPFGLFAAFPSWLNSLPRSGSWMNTVKVVLGFLELALALKFLSVVDLAYHWNFLKIEVFLGLWIVIFLGLTAYLFGLIKFPHDSPMTSLPKGRYALGLASLGFVFYLFQGFNYEPLKLLSGIAPPSHYNLFEDKSEQEYPDCPQGIRCFKDYDEALTFAKEIDKPLMIDFTGHACVNCRKMEEDVWSDERIKFLLSEEYVLVSLYVDDRKKLEESYRRPDGKLVRTVGNVWTNFQIDHFGANSQPLYVLIDNDERVLHRPFDYTEGQYTDRYIEFLECGLKNR